MALVQLPPPPLCLPHLRLDAHKYIIGVEALSDVAGGEGIVMELAMCDLNQAVSGKSETKFTVSQQIG